MTAPDQKLCSTTRWRALLARADVLADQRSLFADGVNSTSDLTKAMGDYLGVRTHFFDTHLLTTTEAGCRQVVLLGSGLDARVWRLPWPGAAAPQTRSSR